MYRKLVLCLCVVLFSASMATAQDVNKGKQEEVNKNKQQEVNKDKQQDMNKVKQSETKELSGISIVGNEDAPKSLYIVPWKSSEIGAETGLDMMLNEDDMPVDRDVFKRKLEFYQVSTKK